MGNEQSTVQHLTFDGTPLPGMTLDAGEVGRAAGIREGRAIFAAWGDGGAESGTVRLRRLEPRERPLGAEVGDGDAAQRDGDVTVKLSVVSISKAPRAPYSLSLIHI